MRGKSNKSSQNPLESSTSNIVPPELNCYEGDRLACFLKSIEREIECAKLTNRALPEKIWLKQQFSIGVNDVTRVLERMASTAEMGVGGEGDSGQQPSTHLTNHNSNKKASSSVQLQAILIASDCNPRWLTKHLPSLALSRKVPLIFVKDKKGGSLRLGQLVKLKTAIAIGVKVRGNAVNRLFEEILGDNSSNLESTT